MSFSAETGLSGFPKVGQHVPYSDLSASLDRGSNICSNAVSDNCDNDVRRLREEFASGRMLHPYLPSQFFVELLHKRNETHESKETDKVRAEDAKNDDGARVNKNENDNPNPITANKKNLVVASFTDLAASLALCCGIRTSQTNETSKMLTKLILYGRSKTEELGPTRATITRTKSIEKIDVQEQESLMENIHCDNNDTTNTGNHKPKSKERKHIIFVLCDGLGNSILENHLQPSLSLMDKNNNEGYDKTIDTSENNKLSGNYSDEEKNEEERLSSSLSFESSKNDSNSFLLQHNNRHGISLRAVFPSTTPTALTTLAVANWPGQHGIPGWDLRDTLGCDFPGESQTNGPIQIRVLAESIMDVRGGNNRPIRELIESRTSAVGQRKKRKRAEISEDSANSRITVDHNDDKSSSSIASCQDNDFDSIMDSIFVERPWVRKLRTNDHQMDKKGTSKDNTRNSNENKSNTFDSDMQQNQDIKKKYRRKLIYINAYNGDDFAAFYQHHARHWENEQTSAKCNSYNGSHNSTNDTKDTQTAVTVEATEFAIWQSAGGAGGDHGSRRQQQQMENHERGGDQEESLFETHTIPETSYSTLGTPEGSERAIEYFRCGINAAIREIALAEKKGYSTYIYLYTAHPDKHMHSLGVDHQEVRRIVQGFDSELQRLWDVLGNADLLQKAYMHTEEGNQKNQNQKQLFDSPVSPSSAKHLSRNDACETASHVACTDRAEEFADIYTNKVGCASTTAPDTITEISTGKEKVDSNAQHDKVGSLITARSTASTERIDAALLVTADHGHVTVPVEDMIELPAMILECLEYANIGVHGKGRHAYLHCRTGYRDLLRSRWFDNADILHENFLLLTIEEAMNEKLFGPMIPSIKINVRPRLGDYIAVSLNSKTLVTPKEFSKYRHDNDRCQGAHGSLLKEEMDIPFILCTP